MLELMSGETGVLRTALGVVLRMEGIDARVRLYLWSGGVQDVVLPVMGNLDGVGKWVPPGAQVVVMFLSDRPQSGMVMGTIDGLLSWRRTGPQAFADYLQPLLRETNAQAQAGEGTLTTYAGLFALHPDDGQAQFAGCLLLADGRVLFLPADGGAASAPRRAKTWDPMTGAVYTTAFAVAGGEVYNGAVLLQDGRVFCTPAPNCASGQPRIYDPELDRVLPAGAPLPGGCLGCVLLPDGRVLLVPHGGPHPLLYDPRGDTLTVSQVDVSGLAEGGGYFHGGVLLPDGRVLLVPNLATAAVVYDPLTDTATTITPPEPWEREAFCGGVLLPDGRVFLAPNAAAKAWVFDPATGSFAVYEGLGFGLSATGAVLLADGRAALLPGQWGVAEMQIFDPATGGYTTVPELLACPAESMAYAGGIGLPDGRVVIAPRSGRDLLVWDPGCGVGYGRDVCLSGFWNRAV
jgi:hypothetical protein